GRLDGSNPDQIIFCGPEFQRGFVYLGGNANEFALALSVGVDAGIQLTHSGKSISDMNIDQRVKDWLSLCVGHCELDRARPCFSIHNRNVVILPGLGIWLLRTKS